MNCKVCGSNGWLNNSSTNEPDKYEKWMGITDVKRCWRKCLGCGLWHHRRNYPLEQLDKIYEDGYRHPDFRGETLRQAFRKIITIPLEDSENKRRIEWLLNTIDTPETLLDIGSGIGVFPYEIRKHRVDVQCVESNNDSIELINTLGMKCTKEIPDGEFDVVSVIHVLEHIEDPVEFLISLHDSLKPDGKLFIEVPDAIEFDRLPPFSDEFNSCHTHFYDVSTLCRVLARAVYNVTDIHREHYKDRNLHRIMMVCQKGE